MNLFLTSEFWYAVIRSTTPVLFSTLAIGITSKCGIINMASEGTMLIAALTGVIASAFSQSLIVGMIAGLLSGVIMAWLLGWFALKLRANIIVAGIAINLFATGGTVFTLVTLTGDKSISSSLQSKVFPTVEIPLIKEIPFFGKILSGHNILTYVALLMVVILFVLLYKTSLGLKIRSVGESEEAAQSVGIKVGRVQFISLTISGLLSACGGMFLSMGYVSMFTANMTAGRGYIALATDAMAGSHPVGAFLASLIYGFSDSLSIYMQETQIPLEFIQMFPYAFIIIVFAVFSFFQRKKEKEISDF